ncbi:hypothetical protein ACFQ3S_15340 [Mucilaginibacter terrae]|uniref:hypothetical protein n=1 Tax=Mucilaginibacter terrae TaxID=1955052 RepID=UPI0036401966
MKNVLYYSIAILLSAAIASCSSGSTTSADSDTTTALSTKPAEQAPVNTTTPKADSLTKTDSGSTQ